MKCSVPGKLLRDSVPGFFIGAGHVTLYLRMYQNSRSPEEKQEVTINYIFIYSLSIVTHSYQGLVGTLLKFEFPDDSQRSALQAGLPKDRNLRPTIITLYCTHAYTRLQWKLGNVAQLNLGGLMIQRKIKNDTANNE